MRGRERRSRRGLATVRQLTMPLLVMAAAMYFLFHSPLRDLVAAALGLSSRVCYFVCTDAVTFGTLATALSAWTLIVLAMLAAARVAGGPELASFERPLVFGLAMLGFISVPASVIAGVAGWTSTRLLKPPGGPLLAALPAALVVAAGLARGWRPRVRRPDVRSPSGLVMLVWVIAAALLVSSSALSILHPPSGYDALGYHAPLAVFLWRDGNSTDFVERSLALAMPGTIQLWFGLLRLAGGEALADLGQLPLALLGAGAIFAFTRRLGLRRGAGQLAAGAFLLSPLVVLQVGVQVADVAGAGLLMATMALASAPLEQWSGRRLALVGVGLGLVVTTKLALLPCAGAVMLFVIAAALWRRRQSPGAARGLVVAALLALAIVAPWGVRNAWRFGNPIYPAALPLVGRGAVLSSPDTAIDREFVPHVALWPLYPLLERHSERSGLGALFLLGLVGGTVIAVRRARRLPLLLYGIVLAVMVPVWWKLTNHDPRFLLPLFGLGFGLVPFALLAVPRQRRLIGGSVLAVGAAFSALVTSDQALLPLAREPTGRWEFYDRVWGVDSAVAALPEDVGLLLHTGFANYTYPGYYPLLGRSFGRLVVPADADTPADSLVALMRRSGIRYAYVTALPRARATVESVYRPANFDLVHVSTVDEGWRAGTRRYLFRLKVEARATQPEASSIVKSQATAPSDVKPGPIAP